MEMNFIIVNTVLTFEIDYLKEKIYSSKPFIMIFLTQLDIFIIYLTQSTG
jgi:hypothetical protein